MDERLKKICENLKLSAQTMWYYKLVGSFNINETTDNKMPTITFRCLEQGKLELCYNNDYIKTKNANDLKHLILHELLHYVSNHISRGTEKDEKIWQKATDIVVNRELKLSGFDLSNMFKIPKDYGLPNKSNDGIFYSAEDYYEMLKNETNIEQNNTNSNKKDKNSKNIKQNKESENNLKFPNDKENNLGKGNISKNNKIQDDNIDYHGYWKQDSKNTNKERTELHFKNEYAQLNDYQKEKVPKIIISYYIESEQNASVNWKKFIKENIQKAIRNSYRRSYLRPSRRLGFGFKGKVSNRIAKIILAIDCSRSIEKEQIENFSKEIIYICKQYPVKLRVIQCNYEVVHDKEYKNKQDFINYEKIEVDGGTSYKPVFDTIKENKYKPNILIYFTDLCWLKREEKKQKNWPQEQRIDSFPEYTPEYKTIWAYCKADKKYEQRIDVPFGYTISID